jgi:NADH-quinone oxidoreductase subunit N
MAILMGVCRRSSSPMEPSVRKGGRARAGGAAGRRRRACRAARGSRGGPQVGHVTMFTPELDAIVPMLCVTLAALASMGAEAFRGRNERLPIGGLGIVGLAGAAVSSVLLWNRSTSGFGVIQADNFGLFVTLTLVASASSPSCSPRRCSSATPFPAGEYYSLVLFAIVGMMMMATASDLLVVFVALEILSLAVYVLTAIRRDNRPGHRGAFKYFLLGAFSSAFFLYGIAFTYGATGSTKLSAVGAYLSAQALSSNPMILIAMGFLLVGFAFKISAVPFHMWTPDAYEGAPAVVTGFMSTGSRPRRLPRLRACSCPRSNRSRPTGRRSSR